MKSDHDYTDDDGAPLGRWQPVTCAERERIIAAAGPITADGGSLTVFSTLTDPEGQYGPPCVYTEWGHRDAEVPLVYDYLLYVQRGEVASCEHAKFVAVTP